MLPRGRGSFGWQQNMVAYLQEKSANLGGIQLDDRCRKFIRACSRIATKTGDGIVNFTRREQREVINVTKWPGKRRDQEVSLASGRCRREGRARHSCRPSGRFRKQRRGLPSSP